MYEKFAKRLLDVVLAAAALVCAAVPMALVALAVRSRMGSPVLFRHERTGRHGETFEMLKFRTMDMQNPDGLPVPSADRLTDLGRMLRSHSLDELPQLINVLRGDMSLVGPRPLLPAYDELYSDVQRRRLEVRPGITGLAQVSGRSKLAWAKKFELDVAYIDGLTFASDVRILVRTAQKLGDRSSTVADGGVIQERFDGTN